MPESELEYFADQLVTFTFVPEVDATGVVFRCYLVQPDGTRTLWGEDTNGAAAGEEIALENRLLNLAGIEPGQHVRQWQFVDSTGEENTIVERHVTFKEPAHFRLTP